MRNVVNNFFKKFGFEVHMTGGRGTMAGALQHLKDKGFSPAHVIDGGASDGRWTRMAKKHFPDAHYMLVDPLSEHQSKLRALSGNDTVVEAALADHDGSAVLHVTTKFNSSLIHTDGEERTVRAITLDSLLTDPTHTLLKLDLEGGEYSVLQSSQLISQVPVVIVECVFSRLQKYCALMQEKGFIVYEIVDLNFDRQTGNMSQVDIFFVPQSVAK